MYSWRLKATNGSILASPIQKAPSVHFLSAYVDSCGETISDTLEIISKLYIRQILFFMCVSKCLPASVSHKQKEKCYVYSKEDKIRKAYSCRTWTLALWTSCCWNIQLRGGWNTAHVQHAGKCVSSTWRRTDRNLRNTGHQKSTGCPKNIFPPLHLCCPTTRCTTVWHVGTLEPARGKKRSNEGFLF